MPAAAASPAQEVAAGVFAGVAVRLARLYILSFFAITERSSNICLFLEQDALACHPVDVIKTQFHVNKADNGSMLKQLREQGSQA